MHSIYCYNKNMEGYLMTNKPNLETIYNHLGLLAPGTPLREGLENILTAKIGALIVVGDSEEVMNVVDGGFLINRDYSPSHLYELAKMDGAIIISMQLEELLSGRENTELLVIKDYMQPVNKKMSAEIIMSSIRNLTYSNLNDVFGIAKELGFTQGTNPQEISLSPHGYRIMNKIPKLPAAVVNNVVGSFKNLHDIMSSTINQLDDIEGIGELRAMAIKEGLKRV